MTRRIGAVLLAIVAAACAPVAVDTNEESPQAARAATTRPGPSTSAASAPPPTSADAPVPAVELEVIGRSLEGRPIHAATVGDGPVRVYVVGSIHGDERTGVETSLPLLAHVAQAAPAAVTVRWLVDANPDGSASAIRDNANGVDLNRNWPTGHVPVDVHGLAPYSEPETQAVADDIEAFGPELIVAMHAAREGPFANYDGPGEAHARAFAAGATGDRAWEVVGVLDWPTPGSLGSHFGSLGIPVVTVEGSRWDDPAAMLGEVASGLDMLLAVAAGLPAPSDGRTCSDHEIGNACTDITRRARDALISDVVGGTSGFLLKEAGGRVLAARWADHPIYAASSIKAVHHLAVVRVAVDDLDAAVTIPIDGCAGTGDAGAEPIGTLDHLMMVESDNRAANAIQAHFGLDALQESAVAAGMVDTVLAHGFGCGADSNAPFNTTTAADLVALYDGVATGELLGPADGDRFFAGMLDITATVAAELGPDPLPDGTRIVAKPGTHLRSQVIAGVAGVGDQTLVFAAYVDRPLRVRTGFTIEGLVAELLRDFIDGA